MLLQVRESERPLPSYVSNFAWLQFYKFFFYPDSFDHFFETQKPF